MVVPGLLQSGLCTAVDLWVKSLAVPCGQAGVGRQRGTQKGGAGMQLADVAAVFCKLSYSWAWMGERGRAAKMGMKVLILPLL